MTTSTGFDHEKYLREQSSAILARLNHSTTKLYLEFGGKLLYDYHAAWVLPGFRKLGMIVTSDPEYPTRDIFNP